MKAKSDLPFQRFIILHEDDDDMCSVLFYDTIKTEKKLCNNGTYCYIAPVYCLNIKYSEKLFNDIQNNYSEYIAMAFEDSNEAKYLIDNYL
jgi:hypothetical protein